MVERDGSDGRMAAEGDAGIGLAGAATDELSALLAAEAAHRAEELGGAGCTPGWTSRTCGSGTSASARRTPARPAASCCWRCCRCSIISIAGCRRRGKAPTRARSCRGCRVQPDRGQLLDVLERAGLSAMDVVGADFDPRVHEACCTSLRRSIPRTESLREPARVSPGERRAAGPASRGVERSAGGGGRGRRRRGAARG